MILTCPRCATRYLVDPLRVWTTGRTVQCQECGQRWRAFGEGERPAPHEPPPPQAEPEPAIAAAAPEVEQRSSAEAPAQPPVEPGVGAEPAPDVSDPAPAGSDDSLPSPSLFRPPRAKRAGGFAGTPAIGRAAAVVCLVLIAVGALALFRDALVHAFPDLVPAYAAVGFPPDPPTPATPHG